MSSVEGVALAGAAAVAFEVSYVLQALEARRADDGSPPSPRLLTRLARRPLWLAGIGLSVGGFALQVLALRQAPLSLVQPVLALGLVLLLVLGRVVLGERAGPREVAGALGIVAGVTLLVAGAPQRGGDGSDVGLAVACVALGAVTLAPYATGARAATLVASAAAGDALAALGMNGVAGDVDPFAATALLWAALAAGAGILALTSESSALQRAPVATVGPVVLAGQIAIPTLLAPLVAGDRWDRPLLVVAGLAAIVAAIATSRARPT